MVSQRYWGTRPWTARTARARPGRNTPSDRSRQRLHDQGECCGNHSRAWDREDPRPQDPAGDPPPHRRHSSGRPHSDDRPGDGVRRRDRDALRRGEEECGRGGISAATPPDGCSLVSLNPIVFTIRHPPKKFPGRSRCVRTGRPTATSASGGRFPTAMRTARMIPIVFWASLPPCPRLKAAPMRADRGEIPCSVCRCSCPVKQPLDDHGQQEPDSEPDQGRAR